jgi:hypothetical protein
MAVLECVADKGPAIIRATRLDENCEYVIGADNSIVTSSIVSFTATPEIVEGAETELTNGNGDVCASVKDVNRISRYTVDLELCYFDPDLLNILVCTDDLVDGTGNTIGSTINIGTVDCPGSFLEIWTKKIREAGSCGAAGSGLYNWRRYIFTKVLFTPAPEEKSAELAAVSLSGFTEVNPNARDGAFSDMPFVGDISANSGLTVTDDNAPPDPECGYSATDVPADANDPTA